MQILHSKSVLSDAMRVLNHMGSHNVATRTQTQVLERVQEQIRKQLDEDARAPQLPFKRFIRAYVGHPWIQAGENADEALLLTARVMGTFACAAYVGSVKANSRASNPDCVVQDDLLLYASKALGVSLLAIMSGSLACSAFAFIGQRQGPCRKLMMWLLVNAYICCCLLFCAAFIANVLGSDLRVWSLRTCMSFIQMAVVFPCAEACAAHRMYYPCLRDEGAMQELRRTLRLKDAKKAWEDPSPPSHAPPQHLSPRPLTPAETLPSLRQLGKNDEEEPSPPSLAASQTSSASRSWSSEGSIHC